LTSTLTNLLSGSTFIVLGSCTPPTRKERKMNIAQLQAAFGSYLRASIAAVAALYMSGITDPKTLLNAFIAGLIGPLAKAVNPKDTSIGINASK
jgi:hypothetical protein